MNTYNYLKDVKIIYNPYYSLRNDKHRVVLTNAPNFKILDDIAEDGITAFIHPVYAMLFSFFNGERTFEQALNLIGEKFDMSLTESYEIISPFIENKERVGIDYDGVNVEYPKNVLIKNDKNYSKRTFEPEHFDITEKLDFRTARLFNGPTTLTILLNTTCATDCLYCYVDRRMKINNEIPITRLRQIIREAKKMGVVDFDIAGTEFFLYKNWEELIEELLNNGYYPYLTTKIPLSRSQVKKLKDLGINHFQFSLDSVDIDEIKTINSVKDNNYLDKVYKTLEYLEEFEIEVAVNSVITKYNSSILGIKKLINKVSKYKNIISLTFNPAERSVYKSESEFLLFRDTNEHLKKIDNLISKIDKDYTFQLRLASYTQKEDYFSKYQVKKAKFNERSTCTANVSQMCILSDGQVTICEELYWDKRFIIGNILENSIFEVWNSKKALRLSNFTPEQFRESSICKECASFDVCRNGVGVCWSNVIMAYGDENWDFPAVECHKAPEPIYNFYHE